MTIEVWNGVTKSTNVFAESLTAVTLDGLPTQVVVLDPSGTIQYVNEAWQRFSSSNAGQSHSSGVGQNYLAVCDAATGLSLTKPSPRRMAYAPCFGVAKPSSRSITLATLPISIGGFGCVSHRSSWETPSAPS